MGKGSGSGVIGSRLIPRLHVCDRILGSRDFS